MLWSLVWPRTWKECVTCLSSLRWWALRCCGRTTALACFGPTSNWSAFLCTEEWWSDISLLTCSTAYSFYSQGLRWLLHGNLREDGRTISLFCFWIFQACMYRNAYSKQSSILLPPPLTRSWFEAHVSWKHSSSPLLLSDPCLKTEHWSLPNPVHRYLVMHQLLGFFF